MKKTTLWIIIVFVMIVFWVGAYYVINKQMLAKQGKSLLSVQGIETGVNLSDNNWVETWNFLDSVQVVRIVTGDYTRWLWREEWDTAEISKFSSPELGITFEYVSTEYHKYGPTIIKHTITRSWDLICPDEAMERMIWCIEVLSYEKWNNMLTTLPHRMNWNIEWFGIWDVNELGYHDLIARRDQDIANDLHFIVYNCSECWGQGIDIFFNTIKWLPQTNKFENNIWVSQKLQDLPENK